VKRQSSNLIDEVRANRRMPSPETARMIRRAAHVTQARMAREIGVDRVTFIRWESGATRPRPELRARWAALLEDLQRELAS
jgi:DNA-binding XRE family transcriptional regulator